MSLLRMTSARKAVLDVLHAKGTHLNAQEILEQLSERLPSLNISTIYRTVEYLAEAGLVSISDIGCGSPVYEAVHEKPHHHLICQCCGEIVTLDGDEIGALLDAVGKQHQFSITTNHLVLYGRCINCQK